jgi:hypothetical protein
MSQEKSPIPKITEHGVASDTLEDHVKLSNKGCHYYYAGSSLKCPCPEGRCWYNEQLDRRSKGLKALTVEAWGRMIKERIV